MLDDPDMRGLITQAVKMAGVDLKSGGEQIILKTTLDPSARRAR